LLAEYPRQRPAPAFFGSGAKDRAAAPVIPDVMRMMTDDETLAGQAADGDREAFCALLSRHYDRLFGLSFRLTGNRA